MISLEFRDTSSFLHFGCCFLDVLIPNLFISSQSHFLNFHFQQQIKFQVFFDFIFLTHKTFVGRGFSSVELRVTVGAVQWGNSEGSLVAFEVLPALLWDLGSL